MATKEISGQLGMATPLGELLGSSTAQLEAEFADYKAMGVNWVRTDFWWQNVQPTANSGYDWSLMDKVVNMAEKYGIKVIAEMHGKSMSWVDTTMSTAAGRQAYVNYVAAAASHFGDKVDHWEIWNEPNMENITPANYTKILQGAFNAINAVDSGDVVISGGLAAAPQTANGIYGAVDYLKGIYANGGEGYFDAVGYHPYTYPLMPDNPASWNGWQIMEDGIRSTMVANGDADLQVWMTELGAPTAGGSTALSQTAQAQIITQATQIASGYSWAGPILWYSYQDRGGNTSDIEPWFGLLGPNGERKAAYYTYKDIATTQEGGAVTDQPTTTPTPSTTFTTTNYSGTDAAENIVGNDQNNTIWASSGADVIDGAKGNDQLWGGAGNDRFVFSDIRTAGWDTIKDFQTGDKIDLSGIDANGAVSGDQAFKFIGGNWLAKAGDLGVYQDKGGWTMALVDVTGDGAYDFGIRVDGTHSLTASDFIL